MFALLVSCSLFYMTFTTAGSIKSCNYCTSWTLDSMIPCHCDEDCYVYHDCCSDSGHDNQRHAFNSSLSLILQLSPGAELKCTSNHINQMNGGEGYYMVSSCPDHWVDRGSDSIREKCSSSDVEYLLPVVDTRTGLVYRNEYCSHCNGVSEILAWDTVVSCSQLIPDNLTFLSVFLFDEHHRIQQECKTESFKYPVLNDSLHNIIPPRKCKQDCLPFSPLLGLSRSQYERLLKECQSGGLNPVVSLVNFTLYHNSACAECSMERYECQLQLDLKQFFFS